jgi:ribosome-associated protein
MTEAVMAKQSSKALSDAVVHGMLEKSGINIVALDLRKVNNAVADYFVICSGNSDTQITSLSESVEDEVYKATGEKPWKKEGKVNKEWVLIDYGGVVVHIFNKERREFYALEKLWGDAKVASFSE